MRRLFGVILAALTAAPLLAQGPAITAVAKEIRPSIHINARIHAQVSSNGVPAGTSYVVDLSWQLPAGQCAAGDQLAPCGATVYRSVHAANSYTLIGTISAAMTPNPISYVDATVANNTAYDYQVETTWTPSGQTEAVNSPPSNTATVTVPNPPGAPTGVTATPAAGSGH